MRAVFIMILTPYRTAPSQSIEVSNLYKRRNRYLFAPISFISCTAATVRPAAFRGKTHTKHTKRYKCMWKELDAQSFWGHTLCYWDQLRSLFCCGACLCVKVNWQSRIVNGSLWIPKMGAVHAVEHDLIASWFLEPFFSFLLAWFVFVYTSKLL